MLKIFRTYYFFLLLLSFAGMVPAHAQQKQDIFFPSFNKVNKDSLRDIKTDTLFNYLGLGKLGLGRTAYDYAIIGYNVLKDKGKISNPDILTIMDFSSPSSKKRLYAIDIKNKKLLFADYVAHGRNTGLNESLYFSNEPESYKSSVGFYTTLGTYTGKHGFSMRLEGQEIGFNNNALERDIVMHSATYVNESVVKSQGYLGRSLGCPAVSVGIYKKLIEKIKNGTCLFIYGNDNAYKEKSKMLKRKPRLEKQSYRFSQAPAD